MYFKKIYDYNDTIFFINFKSEVKILIESNAEDSEVNFIISYIVYNASWSPKYDIRVFGKEKKMIVIIKLYFDFKNFIFIY